MDRCVCMLLMGVIAVSLPVQAQSIQMPNASDIQLGLEKLNVLGSVLYVAAHPDDENTAALAYFSKGRKLRTAYLSLTRGDGGQNLIGSERGAEIGIIRTQELLSARGIDGAEQYFTRAVDFGYSKTAEESLRFWGREEVLADVVWVIRSFRPDVIVTRFPVDRPAGHGHHTASGVLAREAFHAAADPQRFPEQLDQVEPWQAKRLFWNGWRLSDEEKAKAVKIDTGEYDPLLGSSYSEVAALSRSMHKSQGFGATGRRGTRYEYLQQVEGAPASEDLLAGVDTSWSRVSGGTAIGQKLEEIAADFNPRDPSQSLPKLIEAYAAMGNLSHTPWVEVKRKELLGLIQACAGLWIEAISSDYSAVPGETLSITTMLVNRSNYPFEIRSINFSNSGSSISENTLLENNKPYAIESELTISKNAEISQPYWLVTSPQKALFSVDEKSIVHLAENFPPIQATIELRARDTELQFVVPVLYRWTDRVDGELYRLFEIRPPVTVDVDNGVRVFADSSHHEVRVRVKGHAPDQSGSLRLSGPADWRVDPESAPFSLPQKYDEAELVFRVTPPDAPGEGLLRAEAVVGGGVFDRALVEISHPHIKRQAYFPESSLKAVKVDVKRGRERIGYIVGSGDEVPEGLRNLGYEVALLSDEDLESGDLGRFDVIVTGIRAYNTRERLRVAQPRLLKFVEVGGTLIVQYNVSRGLLLDELGPYPFRIGRDRVSEEDAPVTILDRDHPLFNFPNRITEEDFEGWVQERGLYFASEWDDRYETVLASHDSGESVKNGGLLYAEYGQGIYIYSGISWFRQLPAGVPGAYRFLANVISAERNSAN